MKDIWNAVVKFHNDEQGDIVQATIIIGMLATLALGVFLFLGPKIKDMTKKAGDEIDSGINYDGGIE